MSVYIQNFGLLPLEIIEMILDFGECHLTGRLVNKRYHRAHTFRRVRLRSHCTNDALRFYIARATFQSTFRLDFESAASALEPVLVLQLILQCTRLTHLAVSGTALTAAHFSTIVDHVTPRLLDLSAWSLPAISFDAALCRSLRALSRLQALDLPVQGVSYDFLLAESFTTLRRLACRSTVGLVDDECTRRFLPRLTRLTHLSFANCGEVRSTLPPLLRALANVEYCDLTQARVDDPTVRALVDAFPKLRELLLNNCGLLSRGFSHVLSGEQLPRLVRLEMRHCRVNRGHWLIVSQLTSLRRLNVVNCGLEDAQFIELGHLTRLERLDAAYNLLSDRGVELGVMRMRRVQLLDLMCCRLTDHSCKLLARLQHLYEMNLYGNDMISARGVEALRHVHKLVVPFAHQNT